MENDNLLVLCRPPCLSFSLISFLSSPSCCLFDCDCLFLFFRCVNLYLLVHELHSGASLRVYLKHHHYYFHLSPFRHGVLEHSCIDLFPSFKILNSRRCSVYMHSLPDYIAQYAPRNLLSRLRRGAVAVQSCNFHICKL